MKTRKVYQKPMMETEAFVPSAYCAICFKIGCDVRGQDEWTSNPQVTHAADACGNPDNQVIRESSNGSLSMWERSADQGWMYCEVSSPVPFTWNNIQANNNEVVWVTRNAGDGRVWHHKGIAERDQTTSNAS